MRLNCKASGYTFTDYSMNWVKQVPGRGLEWVGRIRTDNFETFYAKALEGRVTITVDTSISTTYLQLASMKPEDTAVYYCARGHSGEQHICNHSLNLQRSVDELLAGKVKSNCKLSAACICSCLT